MKNVTGTALLSRLERFYDAVPRRWASAEPHGALTLFIRRGPGWPFYARPTLGGPEPTAADVRRVRARQAELGVSQEFEWVDDVTPALAAAAEEAGLAVRRCPLLVLDRRELVEAPAPPGTRLRFLDPTTGTFAADAAAVNAVTAVAFAPPDAAAGDGRTAVPGDGRAAGGDPDGEPAAGRDLADTAAAIGDGAIAQVLLDGPDGTLSVGAYQRAGDVAELVGIATLPAARRRGLGAAVTATLARHAYEHGADVVFLSAGDDAAARTYERVGFRRAATACLASPAT